jgi:MFS family permease
MALQATLVAPRPGLRENWPQFALLVAVNALVGGMVGLERTVVPLVATEEFRIASNVLIFSFILAFGLVKAFANLAAGMLADRFTRKNVLVTGWMIGLPVPFMLAYGPSWSWIVAANVLLGASQGFTWSMTVAMKVDLASSRERGLAMGLNECAGYGAVGLTALLTGYVAARTGLRPAPFYIGIVYAVIGLLLSVAVVRDTSAFVPVASDAAAPSAGPRTIDGAQSRRAMWAASQAGFVNNLNDGVSWGVLPLLFAAHGLNVESIGLIKAIYPLTWGIGQIATGALADRAGRRPLIVWGMTVQALALAVVAFGINEPFSTGIIGALLLGIGTAMVYPALLALVSDVAPPVTRATSLGWYRWWRDLGYVGGALVAGIIGNLFGLVWALHIAALLTFASGVVVWLLLPRSSTTAL